MQKCLLSLGFCAGWCKITGAATNEETAIESASDYARRYGKQLSLPGVTEAAQAKLRHSRVLVVGLAVQGPPVALQLAASGVGVVGIMDERGVALEDLCHQPAYALEDVGASLVERLAEKVMANNPGTNLNQHHSRLSSHNAEDVLRSYDVVVDCADSWQEKLLASDVCMRQKKPLVHASVAGFGFHLYTALPGKSACLRCLLARLGMEDIAREGRYEQVFGPVVAMAGALQAAEALKIAARIGITQGDELVRFDGLRRSFDAVRGIGPVADCPDCGRGG